MVNQVQIPVLHHSDPVVNQLQQNVNKVLRNINDATQATPQLSYWSGYHDKNHRWTSTSSSFVDATNVAAGSLIETSNGGFGRVVTADNNGLGIKFTPQKSSSVYLVNVYVSGANETATDVIAYSLTDGTHIVAQADMQTALADVRIITPLLGIYAPETSLAVTLKIQLAVDAGTADVLYNGVARSVVTWTLIQIA